VVDEPNSDVIIVIEEMETSIKEVVETYFEYEYQYEYEYEGALVEGGKAVGKFWAKELACPDHFIRDCSDFCAPAYWIGNGLCDDGGVNTGTVGAAGFPFVSDGDITFMPDTNPANLNLPSNQRVSEDRVAYNFDCAQFWNDGGDCTSTNRAILHSSDTRYAAYMTLSLEVGGRQLGVPTLAIAVMAVVGVAGVAMRH